MKRLSRVAIFFCDVSCQATQKKKINQLFGYRSFFKKEGGKKKKNTVKANAPLLLL